jgi:hypothetical protein
MVMPDGNGHFYIEPVRRPGLLPTPVRGNPSTPPKDTTEGRGQGLRGVYCNGVRERGQEITRIYEPSSRPQEDQGTTRHGTASDGWHGGSPSLI